MAVKKVCQVICDRCGKVVEESAAAAQGDKPALLYVEGTILVEAAKIHFEDLCVKCIARIHTLLGQVRLDESAKGDDAKAPVGDTSPAASTQKPSTPKAEKSADATT